jgi:hypothetical protein
MAASSRRLSAAQDAAEIARTPPPNPYRGQLADPYSGQAPSKTRVPEIRTPNSPLYAPQFPSAPWYFVRPRPPRVVTVAGVIGIVLGCVLAIFGMGLLAILSSQDEFGAPDRSFYRGTDGSYVILALLDFLFAVLALTSGIAFLSGKVIGRIGLTVSGWTILGMTAYWWHAPDVRVLVPILTGIVALVLVSVLYLPAVNRWLGVDPHPQPE